jgi:hypothetical protein
MVARRRERNGERARRRAGLDVTLNTPGAVLEVAPDGTVRTRPGTAADAVPTFLPRRRGPVR